MWQEYPSNAPPASATRADQAVLASCDHLADAPSSTRVVPHGTNFVKLITGFDWHIDISLSNVMERLGSHDPQHLRIDATHGSWHPEALDPDATKHDESGVDGVVLTRRQPVEECSTSRRECSGKPSSCRASSGIDSEFGCAPPQFGQLHAAPNPDRRRGGGLLQNRQ